MRKPTNPADESQRLRALHSYEVLDTQPESQYDDIAELAAHICDVPIALVSLVDRDRQWLKACFGVEARETPREISFCGHTVARGATLVVPDLRLDDRFAQNPLVIAEPTIRFYAGAPLRDGAGHSLGTLCVLDTKPRELRPEQVKQLEALSRLVVGLFEQRVEERQHEAAQAALASVRAEQRRFFELTLDLLCVAGFDGYFKQLNPAWTTTLGFSLDELKSRPFIDFVHPEDREKTIAEGAALVNRDRPTVKFENRYLSTAGDYRWLRWSAAFDPQSDTILAAARDVSHEHLHTAQLNRALEVAQSASRAKSAFLMNMSHELRTPLNSVIGFTNLLGKNKRNSFNQEELLYLDRINANGRHLLSLISDVLDLSRVEGGELSVADERVDLGELISEVATELAGAVGESSNTIAVDVPAGLHPVATDRKRLKQVLINLIGNANKFSEGAVIAVRALARDGVPLRVDVSDSGPGIADGELEFIFEAFHQLDTSHSRNHGGTGLGLSISKSLCEAMKLQLGVRSEVGVGSTFSIVFDGGELPARHCRPRGGEL